MIFTSNSTKLIDTTQKNNRPLLYLYFHNLTNALGTELEDPQNNAINTPKNPTQLLASTKRIMEQIKKKILNDHTYANINNPQTENKNKKIAQFLTMLTTTKKILLTAPTSSLKNIATLETLTKNPEHLYKTLLNSPSIDEVFLNKHEFLTTYQQFRTS